MGIRFRCHQCGFELHVKDFQGGKRSKCPECETKFRIPTESAERSIPLDNSQVKSGEKSLGENATARSNSAGSSSAAMGTLAASEIDTDNDAPQEIDSVTSGLQAAMQPQAILEAPGATWYVRPPAGGQYGPAPGEIFCEWLTENRVTRDSLVWRDGWPQWLVAGDVFTDYFGPAVPQPLAPTFVPGAPSVAPVTTQSVVPEFAAPKSLSDRTLAARKRQRKKNYMIMIGVLAMISIGLVIALVVVLMLNT